MTDKQTSTTNPFIDAWWAGSEQVLRAQTEWFNTVTDVNEVSHANDYFDNAQKSWKQCEEQFQAWLSATEQWFQESTTSVEGQDNYSESFDALKSMLNPATFFSSGLTELDHVFKRLVKGPDFADFGVLEKKFMRINQDWNALRDASVDYQTIISSTWMEAFRVFAEEVPIEQETQSLLPKEMLQRWLKITNDLLIKTQRSDEFLHAQRKLLSASSQYKLKQQEVIESWCETMTLPTRSEVDDLHQIVHQLRREVRDLKRQLSNEAQAKSVVSVKSKPKQVKAKKSDKKSAK